MNPCPLCLQHTGQTWNELNGSPVFRCSSCDLIYKDRKDRLPIPEERAHYDLHNNDPTDENYRNFLRRCTDPLFSLLETGAIGLDFGCGPGPTISVMASEQGFEMKNYDPAFENQPEALDQTYDFITATEVLEHLHHPGRTLEKIVSLTRPGGWIGVMTTLYDGSDEWSQWWYHHEPTHICFYTPATMKWIEARFRFSRVEIPHPNVRLWQLPRKSRK